MKKLFTLGVASVLAWSLVACTGTSGQEASTETEEAAVDAPVDGGWAVNGEIAGTTLTTEQQELFDKALAEMVGVDYEPVCVLGQQIVAGTNYAYLCKATVVAPDAQPTWAVVVIYADLEGNASFTTANDLALGELQLASSADEAVGAWEVVEATESAPLPGEAEAAFEAAAGDTALKPQALLGTQIVAGTNYQVLCLGAKGEEDPQKVYIATIYADLDDNAEITALDALDLAAYTVEEPVK